MSLWERGYGDFAMTPDLATLRRSRGTRAPRCARRPRTGHDGSPVVASPRQILRRQLDRLAERGWTAARPRTELEFMLFRDTYDEAARAGYRDLDPANLYNVDYSILGTARVEPLLRRIRNEMPGAGMLVENSKGECNLGQHEINFRYDEALRPPTSTRSTRTAPRRSPPRRAWRSPSWRSSTSARAARATSTSRCARRRQAAVRRRRRGLRALPRRPARDAARADAASTRRTSTPTSASSPARSRRRRRLGPGQPHLRVPRRRPRRRASAIECRAARAPTSTPTSRCRR